MNYSRLDPPEDRADWLSLIEKNPEGLIIFNELTEAEDWVRADKEIILKYISTQCSTFLSICWTTFKNIFSIPSDFLEDRVGCGRMLAYVVRKLRGQIRCFFVE